MCSGDEEVLAEASANVIGSLDAPRRTRAARRRKRKKATAVPEVSVSVTASGPFTHVRASLDVVRMDTREKEVLKKHRFLRSHNEVWQDLMSWENIRNWRRYHRAMQGSREPASTPVLFESRDSPASAMQLSGSEECFSPGPAPASTPPGGGGPASAPRSGAAAVWCYQPSWGTVYPVLGLLRLVGR